MFTSAAYSAVDICSGWNAVGYMSIDILDDLTFPLTRNGDIAVTAVHFETHCCVNWRACCRGERGQRMEYSFVDTLQRKTSYFARRD